MAYPKQFGQPCWEKGKAEKLIHRAVAQVTRDTASMFLATHSPIRNIKDVRANRLVTEEEAFQNLFSRSGEIRGVVRGASGTGKSHLIRWINLRAEYGALHKEMGLDRFKIIMVQRDVSGSLKAALKQIVDQLGIEFAQYIEDIKSSLDRFSAETARQELISELALEINSKWEQRGHKSLSRQIKPLGDVLSSPGYKRWLGRDGGIIAKKITRLTESSTQEDREKDIIFTFGELIPPVGYLNKNEDAPQVYDFINDIEYEEDIAVETVKTLNLALIDAQRELTGIKGTKLNEIFTGIRRKLRTQGKQLAVFIEDVTAASGGLDLDLFQAFEPKGNKDLCRMIALLGMTHTSWAPLPDNEKDRVNPDYDVGENAIQWAADSEDVSRFAVRYLNAIRCDDQELHDLAQDRFSSDVPRSKCDGCPHLKPCHEIFGYVKLENDVKISLFPFSQTSPQKLLKALTGDKERHRSSPRGLLDYVLNVGLSQSYDHFAEKVFPDARNFPVVRPVLTYWTELENKYLGGAAWSSGSNRNRARFLSEFWFNANSVDESAGLLNPYRRALSLPEFSAEPKIEKKGQPESEKEDEKPKKPPAEDPELRNLLAKLEEWSRGNNLASDSVFRGLLSKMVGKAIRWQDHRGIPIKFANDMTKGIRPIRFEGQTSHVTGQYCLNFPRDDKKHQLLEALVRYEREGKGSWDYENGELHKRRVYSWLRRNQKRIINSLNPDPPTLTEDAIHAASQLLALAAVLRIRAPLPKREPHERIKELFADIWPEMGRPQTLGANLLGRIISDIETKTKYAKELIISELGVGQGDAPPKDFIDPLPILRALEKFEVVPSVKPPPKEINENFWQARFEAVGKLNAYADLHKALDEENIAIASHLAKLKEFLIGCGFDGKDLKRESAKCIDKIIEVIEIQKKYMPYPDSEFDNLWESRRLQNNRDAWGKTMDRAMEIIANPSGMDIICFDPTSLKEAWSDLTIVTKEHLTAVKKELTEQENPSGSEQNGTKEALLKELKRISEILNKD